MKGRIFYSCLLAWLCIAGLTNKSLAQTITGVTFSPSTVCPGSAVTVTYVVSGSFTAGNTFAISLSDPSGTTFPTNFGSFAGRGTGATQVTLPVTLAKGTNYVFRVTPSSSQTSVSTSATKLTVSKPDVPVATSPQMLCSGDPVKPLTATLSDGGTQLNWYNSSSGGSRLASTPQPSTSGTYYVSQTNAFGCESDRTLVEFKVIPLPAAPSVPTPGPSYCQGVTTDLLTATPTGSNTLLWWGTASADGTSSATAPRPDNQNSNTYYVSQRTPEGCVGTSRASISVTIVKTPPEPIVKGPSPVCSGSPIGSLTATVTNASDYELRWWGTSSSGGTSSPTAPSVSNTQSATYYVTQASKVGNCQSSPRTPISVIINPVPAAPTFQDPGTFCQNRATRSLVANAASGATLNWFNANGSALTGAPSPPTNAAGQVTYYVNQQYSTGCTSTTAAITVTVNKVPDRPTFPTPKVYCEGQASDPLIANAAGTLNWFGLDSTSTPSGTASRPETGASFIGIRNYYVAQTQNGCISNVQTIPVQVKDTPERPATKDISFCQNYDALPLSATAASGATLNWYGESSSGGTRTDNPPTVPNTVDKTYTFYVSQTLNGCESGLGTSSGRAPITVRVKTTPGAPGVSPLGLCNNAPTQQLTASGTNIKWFDASDSPLSKAPEPPTGTVGDQVYKTTQTLDGCESRTKAILTVTIKPLPAAPGVKPLIYCQKQFDQLEQDIPPLTASGSELKWSLSDGNPFSNAPVPSVEKAGIQVFLVTQTVNGCTSTAARLEVSVLTPALPTVLKPVVTYCVNDRAVPLEASTNETGAQLRWVDPAGNVSINAPVPSTLNKNVQAGGDPFYVYQIANYGCASARATIRVIVNTPPTLALSAPVTNVNLGQRAPLQLKFTGAGPYSYSLTEGYSGQTKGDTTISVLPRGNTTYQIVSVSNGCGVGLPGTTATITVRVPTVSTSSFATTTLCAGTSLSVPFTTTGEFNPGNAFRIEVASVADTSKKFTFQSTATSSPVTGPIPITLASGQYYVRVKADNPEIGIIGANSPTLLTVRSLASATLTGSQNIYEGSPANLTITFGGDGPWDAVYADSLRTYPITASTNPFVVEARPARTTAYRLTSVSNSCGSGPVSGTATISVLPLLGVDDNSLDPLVKAYPVPTATTLLIELNLPLTREPARITLTDQRGQPVLQHTTRAQLNELNLTDQPSGQYFLRIQVGERQTIRKVLKQ
ncbi:Ig-like domain-containing protein [Spirosoma fluviale]|uniref:Por secretion system C-terminal sorting domain-containing protein n=1 Tax=Spirosoma fluviale TaxID=1597977 RepID=A0A286GML4_9BACT|nr:T9SS type A sorting domain-containing protein [Spirosoma fluviale]SOD96750.1 Por secretion system C-terminal sorting domain-containing protein [Spirosoma fluviale]